MHSETLNDRVPPALLPLWPAEAAAGTVLAREGEHAMSPVRRLERPPLSHLPDDTRAWMGPLLHALWAHRLRVGERIDAAVKALSAATAAHQRLFDAMADNADAGDLLPLARQFGERLDDVTAAFAQLPKGLVS